MSSKKKNMYFFKIVSENNRKMSSSHEGIVAEAEAVLETAEIGKIVVDTVNEVISSLPSGHKNRNPSFAREILQQVFEILSEKEEITEQEVKKMVFTLAGSIKIL
jgi:hypothetical protein